MMVMLEVLLLLLHHLYLLKFERLLELFLLLILLSGFLMAMQLPRYRGQALAAMAAGFAVFIVAVLNS